MAHQLLKQSTKTGFFNAIVNERLLEFGHEGIRKYDLLRWNLLATKIAEARTKIQQIRDRVAPYTYVPQYIYWRNNGEEIQYYAGVGAPATTLPFWRPTQIPSPTTGWTRTDWAQHLNANAIDGKPLWQGFASFFVTGKSELFPYDQATLAAYQGALKQNPNY
jgi:starch-binding outer membrane protein, SusD/RagB family